MLMLAVKAEADAYLERFADVPSTSAVKCLLEDREQLLTFFGFPAARWKHLRTANVIESSFATVRLRQRVTKGAGSRTKGLTMAFKLLGCSAARLLGCSAAQLLDMEQRRWRACREMCYYASSSAFCCSRL